jgi:hypothetical protein
MNPTRTPRLKVGDIVRAEEPDYRYGTGPLLLRVTAVGALQRESDGVWQEVRGQQIQHNGSVEANERYAWIRLRSAKVNLPGFPMSEPFSS